MCTPRSQNFSGVSEEPTLPATQETTILGI